MPKGGKILQYRTPEQRAYIKLMEEGRCLAGQKLLPESIKIFNRVVKLCPVDALPHFYLGLCHQNSGDQYRAMHHYTKAIALDPDFPEVYNNIGKLYADHDGDIKTAISYFEKAMAYVRDSSILQTIYNNLIGLNRQIADYERAYYYEDKLEAEL